ncbi:MAG: glycosyltransferase, partial [Thermoplasmata archaeon]
YNRRIPSIFISHQMRIMNPLRIHMLEEGSELFNLFFFKRFREVIVPDYRENDFSGNLSHNLKRIDEDKIHYVGILSDFKKIDLIKNIDYLISITGPEPQRSVLEKKILSQIDDLNGNIVLTRGKTEIEENNLSENIKIYSYLSREDREEILNRSKMVISRSGYSTIMDLAVIGTKALMIPTPGQSEQEYLALYHHRKGTCYTVDQDNIILSEHIEEAEKTKGFPGDCNVEKTVENILDIIYSTTL